MGSLRLSRAQRAALFSGNAPKLSYPGSKPCPVKEGHVEVLSAHVWLEVTEIRRTSKGEWSLVYTLTNNRLGQRFPAKQDGQLHPLQYTSSPEGAIDDQAVDELTQRRITDASRARQIQDTADLIVAAEDVIQVVNERINSNPDFKREARLTAHRIRRELNRFIERQRRKAA